MRLSTSAGTVVLCAGLIGCGGDSTITVMGHTLTIRDTAYTAQPFFCSASTSGQIQVQLVDYKPACGTIAGGTAGPRNPAVEHSELDLIVALAANIDHNKPYPVSKIDCDNGPGGPAVAKFKYWAAMSPINKPDFLIEADSGNILFSETGETGVKRASGTYDFMIGGTHATGSFSSPSCN